MLFIDIIEEDMTQEYPDRVYVKCILKGKPAHIINELRRRGLARSVREAITMGLLEYHNQLVYRDLREAQAQAGHKMAAQDQR